MERRAFLKGAGIVTVLVAGGGVWRAWDQGVFSAGQGPAYEPWKDWRSPKRRTSRTRAGGDPGGKSAQYAAMAV
jgi:hypothetical protein